MTLSIVILNYRSRGLLRQCLKGLATARLAVSHEIIVVDNASGDGTVSMLREDFPNVRAIASPVNSGFATGNNLGLLAARGQYALILNPDLVVLPGSIERLVAFLDAHPDTAVVAPRLLNPDGTVQASCYRFPDAWIPLLRRTPLGRLGFAQPHLRRYLMTDWSHTETQTVDWALGACLLVRFSAIERVGLFDERYFLYFEDVDWCRRFWEAGFAVYYLPEATLVHYHQRLSAEYPGLRGVLSALTRVHILSGLLYFLKFGLRRPPLHVSTPPSPRSSSI